ncbi:MAG: hypothetical protein V7K27_13830 [Nostoc sp.]|uniref:hypothetical protein n=1 Tax=Nostoc sp. TaxID=1180 RepID=UPI002FF9FDF4
MNNPQKKPLQSVPPKQINPAVDELIALRQEFSKFREDFNDFSKELSAKIAFGVIGSIILMSILGGFLSLLFRG